MEQGEQEKKLSRKTKKLNENEESKKIIGRLVSGESAEVHTMVTGGSHGCTVVAK